MTEAGERQVEAADPAGSVWLSANAGSGKTKVLIDRVARLLLKGVRPERILCLTYTRAAAGEMQNRLFARLGRWAMLEDAELAAELTALGEAPPCDLAPARRLFAQAIETPGGLRIQTIHAFAAALLRRFPLEAGVGPGFTELEDRAAELLRAEILEEMAAGEDREAVDALAALAGAGGEGLDGLLTAIAAAREGFARPLDAEKARALYGLPAGFDAEALAAEVFLGEEEALIAGLLPQLAAGGESDRRAAAALAALDLGAGRSAALGPLEDVFLYGATAARPFAAKLDRFPTRAVQKALGPLLPRLHAFMLRVEAARPRRLALLAAERTAALHRFAGAFLPRYAAAKAARGLLDFDDLIERAGALLSDRAVGAWVLWRLDGGIDHILVDEAQDTSPAQWRLIERLTEEMTAGTGARAEARSLFVVGDKKQSIYSFQGADLAVFDAMGERLRARLADAPRPLLPLTLEHSFRSSPAILRLVDFTFADGRGEGLGGEVQHLAFFPDRPGRVELWPLLPPAPAEEEREWWDPVDIVTAAHAHARLAALLAEWIEGRLAAGAPVIAGGQARALRPGDILILVRRRSGVFQEIIRACKARGLPIAGADRLKLGAELAVKDLAALLSFLATPEDDLALAAALRSPLFGWSEGDLFRLAHGRQGYLWQALRARRTEWPETFAILKDLRDQADFLRPYDLAERILERHDGRRRLIARLGAEAEDGIDQFLAQALAYERSAVPSLTGFLGWLETDEVEVRRQPDAAGDRIRIMTVHGAKGLEAPLVILPDTGPRGRPRGRPFLPSVAEGLPLWRGAAAEAPPLLAEAAEAEARRQAEEDRRLLYVALTRAQSWLVVCGAGRTGPGGGEGRGEEAGGERAATDGAGAGAASWHELVRLGMQAAGAVPVDTPAGQGLRLEHGAWPATAPPAPPEAPPPPLPAWAREPPPPPPASAEAPRAPSDLGGAKALPGEEGLPEELARARGRALHLLLEHLPLWPAEKRAARAAALLAAEGAAEGVDPEELLAEAERVLAAPALAPLFGPDALAEVGIAAALPELGGLRIEGRIDRLIPGPDRVLAVDFKSNAMVPGRPEEVPEGLLRQMGAYAAALAQVYPGRRIETALLWTRSATLMPLPSDLVMAALRRAAA